MANIPIEKKSRSGAPWWLWLIGLLLLAGLIWLLAEAFESDEDEVAAVETTEEVAPVEQHAAGEITSVAMLLDASDYSTLYGREAELSGLRVTSVVGDSTFYVTPQSDDRRFLVALNEVIPSPPPGVEGRYDITEGQVVTIYGTIRELTRMEPETWGITEQEAQQMMDDAIYLRAQRIDITQLANK